jgi:hypothetical protein
MLAAFRVITFLNTLAFIKLQLIQLSLIPMDKLVCFSSVLNLRYKYEHLTLFGVTYYL